MNVRSVVAVAVVALMVVAPGCGRLGRSALRMGTRGSGSRSSQPTPEEMRFHFTGLDAETSKKLDGYRKTYAEYVEKYGATELSGSAQVAAVVEALNNAHWSERPKNEDCARPIAAALGDVLVREAGVNWIMVNGGTLCLGNPTGKVLVGPLDITMTWLTNKTHPIKELITEVKDAIRNTTGEPIEIGTKPDVDESDEDMI